MINDDLQVPKQQKMFCRQFIDVSAARRGCQFTTRWREDEKPCLDTLRWTWRTLAVSFNIDIMYGYIWPWGHGGGHLSPIAQFWLDHRNCRGSKEGYTKETHISYFIRLPGQYPGEGRMSGSSTVMHMHTHTHALLHFADRWLKCKRSKPIMTWAHFTRGWGYCCHRHVRRIHFTSAWMLIDRLNAAAVLQH